MPTFDSRRATLALGAALLTVLAGCASDSSAPQPPPRRPADLRAQLLTVLPPQLADRQAWATDIVATFSALQLDASPSNLCAALAVVEQESTYRADPPVANLSKIAWDEIDRRAEKLGVPKLLVRGALLLESPNGQRYSDRIDAVKTERQLSEIFEDFIGMVPLGQRLFAGYNPVRTGGPMQVSIAFAERQAKAKPYPFPMDSSVRREVFTRRGGLYFGIAHLLDYPASYDRPIYRFADFNAGQYASRNAAFQNALSLATGIPLALDGDLVAHDNEPDKPGSTEVAARSLARQWDMNEREVRRALEQGDSAAFERTNLYRRVFEHAERLEGRPLPRAMIPKIKLESPKITRQLTTEWFANRVNERHQRCMARIGSAG